MQFFKKICNKKSIVCTLLIVFTVVFSLGVKDVHINAATSRNALTITAQAQGWTYESSSGKYDTHMTCENSGCSKKLYFSSWNRTPTCVNTGIAVLKCSSGHTKTVNVNALGHDYHEIYENGYLKKKCNDCGDKQTIRGIYYTIKYDKNSSEATGYMPNTSCEYGKNYGLRHIGFSRQYYNFIGWSTSPDGGVVYYDGQTIKNLTQTEGDVITLYAKWEGVKSNLMINPFGGTWNGSTDTQSFTQSYNTTIEIPVPTRNGYKFTGWTAVNNFGSMTSWTGASTFTFGHVENSNTVLNANWEPIKYTISYDGNGATSGYVADHYVTKELSTRIRSNSFFKDGCTFAGWNTSADGTGTSWAAGTEYSTLADLKLYAQWSVNGSTLIVDPDGGTWNGSTDVQSFNGSYGETKYIPAPTKTGFVFDGWERDSEFGSMSSLNGNATYTFGATNFATDKIKAKWKEIGYTITYYGNGATGGSTPSQTKSYTSDVVLNSNGFIRPGYRFSHWCTTENNSGTEYEECSTYSTNADLNLYAIWAVDNTDRTNTKKHAFDTDTDLPNVKVTNVTLTYDTSNGVEVDYASNTTNVAFAGWTKYANYTDSSYYYLQSSTNTEAGLKSLLDCDQCGTGGTVFHGALDGALNRHYTYNHGSWANNSGEHKNGERNSLAVASFNGSWKLVLPNAYKTGYLFTGWYVKTTSGEVYVGMAGDTYDLSTWVRKHNTEVSPSNPSPTGLTEITTGVNDNLSGIILHPHFEPIKYKILYVMNIPSSNDPSTAINGLESHTALPNPQSLTRVHSLKTGGSIGNTYTTDTASIGSTDIYNKDYSYIGSKTYTYDGSDWILEDIPITVNDYYFTGWTYDDIVWTGYGGMNANGVTLGSTRIGNGIADTHDISKDYSLKTLSMSPNVVQNIKNNLPDTANNNRGYYTSYYTVSASNNPLAIPQTDGTNPLAGNKASGLNNTNPTVYIVLKANWTDETIFDNDIVYDSNNQHNYLYTATDAFTRFTEYVNLLKNNKSSALPSGTFGDSYSTYMVDSKNTAAGDTSDDGSYDKNATSDRFVVNPNIDRYFNGESNGRKGFYSFQGWSTWKYATWRDAIDSNKKDTDASELQYLGAASGTPLGHDNQTVNSTFSSGSLIMRRYNDVARPKRVGDLFYRMAGVLYPEAGYNTGYVNTNRNGPMVNSIGTGENYKTALSEKYWGSYKWRWTQGTTGHYAIPISGVLDEGVHLYAIWDSYPTSMIENTYVYLNNENENLEKLTPKYLFSKVIAYDYEDFWNQKNCAIGATYDGNVDWGTVASASPYMNTAKGHDCPDGDYTYTYSLKGNGAYMGGTFTATLIGYDYDRFINAAFVDDVASVSMTFKFVDSAGNTTYKTAWVYIIDDTDTERDHGEPKDPDNTRYSLTRFISKEFYNKADFDENGNYIVGSADESAGSLLVRSKWYLNNNYKSELLSAFDRLETIGDSRLTFDLSDFTTKYVDSSGEIHSYHPKYNDETNQWEYEYDALATQTKGVYVLEYDDIVKTKQFIQNNDLDTGNYSGDTIQKYIDDIFGNTAAEDSHKNKLRIDD